MRITDAYRACTNACAMRAPRTFAMHTPCTHHAHTCTHHAHTMHIPCTYLEGEVLLLDDAAHVLGLGGGGHAHLLGVRVRF